MMYIFIFLAILSLAANIFLFFYIRWLLKSLTFVSNNMVDTLVVLTNFSNHLEALHTLETYYGDQTLMNLIEHSKQIIQEIKKYKEVYTLAEGDVDMENLYNDEAEEDQEEEKAVFYTGP